MQNIRLTLILVLLSVIILNVIRPSAFVLNVVDPLLLFSVWGFRAKNSGNMYHVLLTDKADKHLTKLNIATASV